MALDEKPLLGTPPQFPLENFATLLTTAFQAKSIQFHCGSPEWKATENLYDGYGDNLKIFPLNITPIEGAIWWVMSKQDFIRVLTNILSVEGLDTLDPHIDEVLTSFFLAQVTDAFGKCSFDKMLSLQILNNAPEPSTPCLAIDVETSLNGTTFPGRLLLSPDFRHNLKQKYLQDEKKLMLESPLAESLEVVIHIEAGRLNIAPKEWNELHEGDFVALENCSLNPDEDKAKVMLVINGTPFFRAKLKQGNLKILEYPQYYEVPPMNDPKNEQTTHSEGEDFDADFDESESEGEGEKAKADAKHADPHPAADPADEDFDIEAEEAAPEKEEKTPAKAHALHEKPAGTPTSTGPTSLEDVSLCVVLELGRLQMSIKKLLELQPGNMLELNIHPEDGVDMVVNGKRVARGELLKIGDAIGVRISERL
jgi:flagellar motor switch protein FliN/FliY